MKSELDNICKKLSPEQWINPHRYLIQIKQRLSSISIHCKNFSICISEPVGYHNFKIASECALIYNAKSIEKHFFRKQALY